MSRSSEAVSRRADRVVSSCVGEPRLRARRCAWSQVEKSRAACEIGEVNVSVHVRLLHHVQRLVLFAEDGADGAVDALVVTAHHDLERLDIPRPHAQDDVLVRKLGRLGLAGFWGARSWLWSCARPRWSKAGVRRFPKLAEAAYGPGSSAGRSPPGKRTERQKSSRSGGNGDDMPERRVRDGVRESVAMRVQGMSRELEPLEVLRGELAVGGARQHAFVGTVQLVADHGATHGRRGARGSGAGARCATHNARAHSRRHARAPSRPCVLRGQCRERRPAFSRATSFRRRARAGARCRLRAECRR